MSRTLPDPTAAPPGPPHAGSGSGLLASMLRIRLVEEAIRDLYAEEEIRCPTHFSIGQEAVAVGVCAALRPEDRVTSAHRSHAHYLARGGSLPAMVAELYGKATGCARGKGGSMHLIDLAVGFLGAVPIVGSTIPIGVGAAFASRLLGEGRVTAIFFGDAATETGIFHESLSFAVLHRLPVVMVCENNLYSVLSPLHVRQPGGRRMADLARAHGALALVGDGNDVEEVLALGTTAVEHARGGAGPAFVELATYRWLEHCGPLDDEHLGYRPPGELDAWKGRDPVRLHLDRLLATGSVDEATVAAVAERVAAEMAEAVAYAKASPFPAPDELGTDVYAP